MTTAKKKTAAAAAESVQEPLESPEASQPQETEKAPQETAEGASGAILGPEKPEELLGCMEDVPDADDIREGFLFYEYAVTASGGLKLRDGPSPDAPVLSILPYGAGVWTDTVWDSELDWIYVRTGTLAGWMMTKYLIPVDCDGAE